MLPDCVTTGCAGHWSVSRSRATSVVTGDRVLAGLPRVIGRSGSSSDASCAIVTGLPAMQLGFGPPFTAA